MKKTLLTLSAVAFALCSAQAQMKQTKLRAALAGPGPERAQQMRQLYGQLGAGAQAAKTTAQTQRLVGYSSMYQGALYDSARYVYNSTVRGSYHANNNLNSYYFNYYPFNSNLPLGEGFVSGSTLTIKCDTGLMLDAGGVYMTLGLNYNAANEPTQYRANYFSSGTPSGRDRYTMTYNGGGQRTELLYEVDTNTTAPGTLLQDYRMYTSYGGTPSRALRDSIAPFANAPFATSYRYLYNYTGNNLTSMDVYGDATGTGTYVYEGRYEFTYDASNRLRSSTLVVDFSGSGTPAPFIRDSLVYTGTNSFPTSVYISFYDNTASAFELAQSLEYTINAQNLRDTMRIFEGTGDLVALLSYQYNSYGNPDSYRYFDPAVSTTVPEETGRFYYELYDPNPTSVEKMPIQTSATAYPNPVVNELALRWPAASGNVQLRIADATGRIMEAASFSAATGLRNVDMSRYAPGTYFVTLQGAGIQQSLKVVKK